jgi:hypothetical protein
MTGAGNQFLGAVPLRKPPLKMLLFLILRKGPLKIQFSRLIAYFNYL